MQVRAPVVVQDFPPGVPVAVYLVMDVPLSAGAVQAILTAAFSEVTLIPVGLPGTLVGITVLEGVDVGPVPFPLWAWTLKVYLSPLARPVTVQSVVPVVVQVFAVGELVTV